MSWIVLATVLLITLIIALIMGKLKKAKPIIELLADEQRIRYLDLKPSEFVRMEPDTATKAVTVYSAHGDMLGVLNNGFIFRNVIRRNIEARIESVTGGKIMLEIVRVT